jgi:hypothetical protein
MSWAVLTLQRRFWSKVHLSSHCWEWTAARQLNGYGRFRLPDRHVGAHVMAYELSFGPVPDGLEVHHTCENRLCVRPTHLRATTHRDNLLASATLAGVNARKTHCIRNHEFTPENTLVDAKRGKRSCRTCRNQRRRELRNGDIGEPVRHIEFEPMPQTTPIPEPSPEVAPAEPEKVPA